MDIVKYTYYKDKINEFIPKIEKLKISLNLNVLQKQIDEFEKEIAKENFWEDLENAKKITRNCRILKEKAEKFNIIVEKKEDCKVLLKMIEEEDDDSLFEELEKYVDELEKEIEKQSLEILLNGEYDFKNAILTLHAGAGGTEAMDWVQMLYRMYDRWAERHKFKTKVLNLIDGEEAGIKSISILVQGQNAYGFLHCEVGVHRLVRISPFDSSGRRHTSFASVEVLPEIDEDLNVEISDDDIKMDVFRASGAGGQHVNKTSSAVRLTHIPTGIVTSCQNERSQIQNKNTALKILKSKLLEIKEREHLEKIEDIKGVQKEIAWGSQIRSYVFMPYTLVKDHRTKFENANINSVMDGDIDGFITAFLVDRAKKELEK